jgi:hypothetical protein
MKLTTDIIHYKETPYGFEFGAADVTRCAADVKKGWIVLEIKTPKDTLQIYVTKTGKVRVHNKQCKELV